MDGETEKEENPAAPQQGCNVFSCNTVQTDYIIPESILFEFHVKHKNTGRCYTSGVFSDQGNGSCLTIA